MHIRRDVPEMLAGFAARHPAVAFRFGRPFGADPRLAEILMERAGEAACLA
jgi:sirohydrochlorin cobaltochelatase